MSQIRSLLINILSKILSILTDKSEKTPTESEKKLLKELSPVEDSTSKEKKVFGKEDIPELKYYKIIELLHNHYAHEEQRTGQIGPEIAKQLSSMSFKEVKELFDMITMIKMNHKDYIDGEIQEENEIADKEGVSLS